MKLTFIRKAEIGVFLILLSLNFHLSAQQLVGPYNSSQTFSAIGGAWVAAGTTVTINNPGSVVITFNQGLHIEEGGTLIVNGATIKMGDNQEIRLDQPQLYTTAAAHLVLNSGSIITSLTSTPTGNRWQGINIAGVPGPITINAMPLLQMNGATIQYADCAFNDYGADELGKGRLHAVNSTFLNNVRCLDVSYTGFGWYPSDNTIEWVGIYARDCTFKLTADFPVTPPDMIRAKYSALGLHSCSFIAQPVLHSPPAPDVINYGYLNNTTAIDALESYLWIEQSNGSSSGCEFGGFKNGLVIDNVYVNYPVTVSNSTFSCVYGMNVKNAPKSLIIGNESYGPITASGVSPYVAPNNCSIYADNCAGIQIEGNNIGYDYNPYTTCFGIVNRNCTGDMNQNIYRNTVQVLTEGADVESVGWNRSEDGTVGLKILCNTLNSPIDDYTNSFNIAVVRDPTGGSGNNPQGIRNDQFGASGESAGNLFYSNTGTTYSSYYMEGGTNNMSAFTYRYNPAVLLEKPPYNNIINMSTTTANNCPVMMVRDPQDSVTLVPLNDKIKIIFTGPDTAGLQQRLTPDSNHAQMQALNNMINVNKWLITHHDNWNAIPASFKEQVYDVEMHDQAQGGSMAKAFLHRYEGKQYDPVLVMPKPVIAALQSKDLMVSIYPNPAQDKIEVTWQSDESILRIVNIKGQSCLTKTIKQGNNTIELDGLAAGTYIVQIQNADNKIYTQKLTVE